MRTGDPNDDPNINRVPPDLRIELIRYLGSAEPTGENSHRFETVAALLQELMAKRNGGHQPIDTWSGEQLQPGNPNPDLIHLEDIAHGLSNIGRFSGQSDGFYSVGRHSIHVSREIEASGGGLIAQQYGLLHDAPEAYLSDVPGPVKETLPGYRLAERRLDSAIREAFDLTVPTETEELVEATDEVVSEFELTQYFPERSQANAEPTKLDAPDIDSSEVKETFLERAKELKLLNE